MLQCKNRNLVSNVCIGTPGNIRALCQPGSAKSAGRLEEAVSVLITGGGGTGACQANLGDEIDVQDGELMPKLWRNTGTKSKRCTVLGVKVLL